MCKSSFLLLVRIYLLKDEESKIFMICWVLSSVIWCNYAMLTTLFPRHREATYSGLLTKVWRNMVRIPPPQIVRSSWFASPHWVVVIFSFDKALASIWGKISTSNKQPLRPHTPSTLVLRSIPIPSSKTLTEIGATLGRLEKLWAAYTGEDTYHMLLSTTQFESAHPGLVYMTDRSSWRCL